LTEGYLESSTTTSHTVSIKPANKKAKTSDDKSCTEELVNKKGIFHDKQ
jgi:hypothetical protein